MAGVAKEETMNQAEDTRGRYFLHVQFTEHPATAGSHKFMPN